MYPNDIITANDDPIVNGIKYTDPNSTNLYDSVVKGQDIIINGDQPFSYQGNVANMSQLVCFLPDSKVLTKDGYVKVQNINRGDLVLSPDGREVAVLQVIKYRESLKNQKPYLIKKDSFGLGVPNENLYLSKTHRVFYKNKMVEPKKLLNYPELKGKVIVSKKAPPYEYYNLQVEDFTNIVVNNLEVESLQKENEHAI